MKPLGYRELFWEVSAGPETEDYSIAAFDSEQAAFDAPTPRPDASPIALADLLRRLGSRSDGWTRRRVRAGEARDVGTELLSALPPSLVEPLREGSGPIRVKIATSVPAIGDLPWEWLTAGVEPFALRPDVVVARSVPLRFPVLPLSVERPLSVLMLLPNPKDERLLVADQEIDAVRAGLDAAGFDVRILDLPQLEELADALAAEQPTIVHYIGHGGLTDLEGNLILQGADGRSRWVPGTELAALLPSSVRLLCLSTPFTAENYQVLGLGRVARAAGVTGLPTTVVNQHPVSEQAVREFWHAFYAALVDRGGNVNEAVQAGRMHVATVDPAYADWGSFSLVVRDQTGVSFDLRAVADLGEKRAAEIRAQFAAESANELAKQVQVLGAETPSGLKRQFEVQERLVTGLLDELAE